MVVACRVGEGRGCTGDCVGDKKMRLGIKNRVRVWFREDIYRVR